ncbi:CLUMA_CG018384, isoform A [Clunio marinus]|uniref:CLUMA_CG018384, isoform A n=1 Tax=Clunio marinus TaxID=568069 RepID=A0A1J1IZ90_9DIPT|nr:CLUMA_CG018384, isoform A [Clunio marinus]
MTLELMRDINLYIPYDKRHGTLLYHVLRETANFLRFHSMPTSFKDEIVIGKTKEKFLSNSSEKKPQNVCPLHIGKRERKKET